MYASQVPRGIAFMAGEGLTLGVWLVNLRLIVNNTREGLLEPDAAQKNMVLVTLFYLLLWGGIHTWDVFDAYQVAQTHNAEVNKRLEALEAISWRGLPADTLALDIRVARF
jgi:hypothetical protein